MNNISTITVVLNDDEALERTIQSVFNQTCHAKEFIIIDGGSTDGSVELIKKYKDSVSFWISEPDKGIYDAMNKGLKKATSEWVLFLNAGDVFSDEHVLEKIFSQKTEDADVIYGDSIADYGSFSVYRAAGKPNDLWKGMFCSHQSMLFRREALLSVSAGRDESGRLRCFNTDLHISADHDLVCRLYRSGVTFKQVAIPVAVWETGGLSNRMQVRSVIERYRMIEPWFHRGLKVRVYYLWLVFLAALVEGMYRLLPLNLMKLMIRLANRKSLVNQSKPGSC